MLTKLGKTARGWGILTKLPKASPDQYIPEDGICPDCDRLKRGHPGVERALAANGLTRQRPDGSVAVYPAVPYCVCGDAKAQHQDRREQHSNLPGQSQTFLTFRRRPGAEEAFDAATQFAQNEGPPILVLTGGAGSGKTHLLQAIGYYVLHQGESVRYELVSDLLTRLRATYDEESRERFDEVISFYKWQHWLLLDDLGLERSSEWVVEQVTALVDDRYRNNRRLAVATNASRDELAGRLGFRLASRLWDINSGRVRLVHLTCGDYRLGN